jgi:hypothetical protein
VTCQICLDEVPPAEMFDKIGCKRCAATEYGDTPIGTVVTFH